MILRVRRLAVLCLGVILASACSPPGAPPPPTPTRFVPANLLTPRPTVEPTGTPVPRAAPTAGARQTATAVLPTASPTASVRGTPVAASEPLVGMLRDDRLTSPIIGEDFTYRIYLPP